MCIDFSGIVVNAKVSEEDIASLKQALSTAIQFDNRCTSSADCATVPVGSRACGGPNSYAVYSKLSSNAQAIRSLAQLTTQLEQQYNEENSVISICSLVTSPTPVCDETMICDVETTFLPLEPVVV